MVSKEDFYKVWENPINALNQFYYEHYELLEAKEKIDKAIEILKDTSVDMPSTLLIETIDYARHILGDKENE